MYIDSHCHLDLPPLADALPEYLQGAKQAGVCTIVVPGLYPKQWQTLQVLCSSNSAHGVNLYSAIGLHPWWTTECPLSDLEKLMRSALAEYSGVVAVGECGLDGVIETPLKDQIPLFELQLRLAAAYQLPVIVHVRKAHNEVLKLLSETAGLCGGVIHGFSGSLEQAQQYWRLGFYIGVGGTITYERAAKTRRAIASMPLEALVLETDAPDMPLSGYQGEPNKPSRLPQVAQALADLRDIPLSDMTEILWQNTHKLFNLCDESKGRS